VADLPLTFRRVEPADGPFLTELAVARWAHLPLPELAELQDRAQRREYVDRFGVDGEHLVLLDGMPVGRAWWSDSDAGRWIVDVALLPTVQRRGVGTSVFKVLIAGAGGRAVYCSVEASMGGWRGQLEQLGLVETSSDEFYVSLARPASLQAPET
jgi:hypothetical protein